jgi:hypothetical protein
MSQGTLSFSNVTPDQFAKICEQAETQTGIVVTGNDSSASKLGVSIAWKYDGSSILIFVINRGMLDPSMQTIESKLFDLVQSVRQ